MTATTADGRATPAAEGAGAGYETGYGTKAYRSYVLTALLFVYILNFVDRGLLAVVGPVIKPELGINDTLFGLLTGVTQGDQVVGVSDHDRGPWLGLPGTGAGERVAHPGGLLQPVQRDVEEQR